MQSSYLMTALVFSIGIVLVFYVFKKFQFKSNRVFVELSPVFIEEKLRQKVRFYTKLEVDDQIIFKERVRYFLRTVKISGEKGVVLKDEDLVLIAASATIPLIHFETWAYENLDEVIVYPDYFDERFDTDAQNRNVAGMVGSGVMNHKMILSLPALREGFEQYSLGNTAVHEFVHLIDKADGEVDGVPEFIIPKNLIDPWMKEMDQTIRQIRNGESDIRTYAATNDGEFLAVLSEYFFQKPKLLKEEHPDLFDILDKIYNRRR